MHRFTAVRRIAVSLALAAIALAGVLPAVNPAAADGIGPPGGRIYAHDRLFRTVATPTDLPPYGNFQTIWVLGNGLASVADAAPGDPGFYGGRWAVRPVTFTGIAPTQFTNAEQVRAAAAAGQIQIGEVVRHFECPLLAAH